MPCDVLRLSPCTEQPHPLVGHVTGDMKRRESNETHYVLRIAGAANIILGFYDEVKMARVAMSSVLLDGHTWLVNELNHGGMGSPFDGCCRRYHGL